MSLISKLEQGTSYVSNGISNIAKYAVIYSAIGVSALNPAYSSEPIQKHRQNKTESSKLEKSAQESPEKREYTFDDLRPLLGEERIKAAGDKLSNYEKIFNNKPTKEKELIVKLYKNAQEKTPEYLENLETVNNAYTLKKDHPELFRPKLPSWIKNTFTKNKSNSASNPLEDLKKMQDTMKKLCEPSKLQEKFHYEFPWLDDFSKLNDPNKYPIYAPEREFLFSKALTGFKEY